MNLIDSASGRRVQTVIVNGSMVMEGRRFSNINKSEFVGRPSACSDAVSGIGLISDLHTAPGISIAARLSAG